MPVVKGRKMIVNQPKVEGFDFFKTLADQDGNWSDLFGKKLSSVVQFPEKVKVLSLFSGAGGLDIGFHDCGFEIVEAVEVEEKFVKTLNNNTGLGCYFGDQVNNQCIDICNYETELNGIELIIGGPPCQSFSAAGARAAGVSGIRDARGRLFEEYVRLLKQIQPKAFVFENVYRILGSNNGRDWAEISQAFANSGYELKSRILSTADYGVPQFRERLIIVGLRKDICSKISFGFPRPTHGPDSSFGLDYFSAGKALAGMPKLPLANGLGGKYGDLLLEIPPGLNYSFFTEKLGNKDALFAWRSKFSDFLYKADPDRPVRTIKAQGGKYTGPFHWESRPFTVDELKRLQTFPDEYSMVGSRITQIKQIGNSVPPQFSRILAMAVAEQIFSAKLPFHLQILNENDVLNFKSTKNQLTKYYNKLAKDANLTRSPRQFQSSVLSYNARFNADLNWKVMKNEGATHSVIEEIQDDILHINLTESQACKKPQLWKLNIKAKDRWTLPYSSIVLSGYGKENLVYTALWKALEEYLVRNKFKADLVQLSNYYQYDTALKIKVEITPNSMIGGAIKNLLQGKLINQIFTLHIFSKTFKIPYSDCLNVLLQLKELGYEVRSKLTNEALADDEFLVPYSFPTLSFHSVQKNKRLF